MYKTNINPSKNDEVFIFYPSFVLPTSHHESNPNIVVAEGL